MLDEAKTQNLTIFLMKDYIKDYNSCLKNRSAIKMMTLKDEYNLDGVICIANSSNKPPRWKEFLQKYSSEDIELDDNTSNKALMLVKLQERILALSFGYGRAFLKEEAIEKNFGFKTALNVISPEKIRSVNAATIEDMVVNTQRQSSHSTSQEEFGLNVTNDIMMAVTGIPQNEDIGKTVSGKDSFVVSVCMDADELKIKLESYLNAYNSNTYKDKGFDWIDNVRAIKDSVLREELDFALSEIIKKKDYSKIQIASPDTVNWNDLLGFCFSGIRKDTTDANVYSMEINYVEYFDSINDNSNLFKKLKRDKLYGMNNGENPFAICNVYSALIAQMYYDDKTYILNAGTWYEVNNSFYSRVTEFISSIPISNLSLPKCPKGMNEGEYNLEVAKQQDYYLMDKRLVSVLNGPKHIEACDIFTRDKQFVHVKNKCRSSQLSHLFAQGRVSAQAFTSDQEFRKQVWDKVKSKFGEDVFDYHKKPESSEYEVVYAIIDEKTGDIEDRLPFFSKVNLMLSVQELDRMHMKYSIMMIEKS
ncbi:hypothetical protein CE91St62_22670 [Lachnospiraceae bacterium]|uniref:TIGR04141 family sporadically distributed protein n=1 Tax=Extibacter sp. GGCC_0201 TaxID=2731209 RepID=UPI001AA1D4B3|nr:TIGR04141 family sporadically distributed protein [Extibacter sp. GGCC_0201]MBO1719124.1 TIGR04141 family sporadically distributed protein [Extibacter sp. GGCC_0201]BDF34202.1 hypothetical protein CE91St61_22770 [Lachnospiraceae bacterium]BDF38206.1 hypothetical protein CE91St62_22670 [Lachnospiraceae bacterium]